MPVYLQAFAIPTCCSSSNDLTSDAGCWFMFQLRNHAAADFLCPCSFPRKAQSAIHVNPTHSQEILAFFFASSEG